jgi:hypothetical protein
MTRTARLVGCALVALVALTSIACVDDGIGIGVPSGGARWSGPGSGPDVLVAGGPVYR